MTEPFVVPSVKAQDRVLTFALGTISLVTGWATWLMWTARKSADGAELNWLTVLAFVLALLTVQLIKGALGGLWRLANSAPRVAVRPEGLVFHPSLRVGLVPWREVRGTKLRHDGVSLKTAVLQVVFARSFVAPLKWIPGRRLTLRFPGRGNDAERLVRAIEAGRSGW